jgi:hypothetical protein
MCFLSVERMCTQIRSQGVNGTRAEGGVALRTRDDGCLTTPRRRHARRLTERSNLRVMCPQRPADAPGWRPCYASTVMLVRFRQTAAGLQCSLVETRRIDGAVRYEQVASLGSVPASPSVSDRIAFWRRVYETLAELASRIDADTQGKIISAVHSRPDSYPQRTTGAACTFTATARKSSAPRRSERASAEQTADQRYYRCRHAPVSACLVFAHDGTGRDANRAR